MAKPDEVDDVCLLLVHGWLKAGSLWMQKILTTLSDIESKRAAAASSSRASRSSEVRLWLLLLLLWWWWCLWCDALPPPTPTPPAPRGEMTTGRPGLPLSPAGEESGALSLVFLPGLVAPAPPPPPPAVAGRRLVGAIAFSVFSSLFFWRVFSLCRKR